MAGVTAAGVTAAGVTAAGIEASGVTTAGGAVGRVTTVVVSAAGVAPAGVVSGVVSGVVEGTTGGDTPRVAGASTVGASPVCGVDSPVPAVELGWGEGVVLLDWALVGKVPVEVVSNPVVVPGSMVAAILPGIGPSALRAVLGGEA